MLTLIHFYPRSPCGERRQAEEKTYLDNKNFYPRSPCGERQQTKALKVSTLSISIHALLAESDAPPYNLMIHHAKFLSTLSLRRATVNVRSYRNNRSYFYPRSPCGERQIQNARACLDIFISIHALLAESDDAECLRL